MIGEIVRLLEDGQWHAFSDIERDLSITENQFQEAIRFLRKFGLVDIDAGEGKVKIDAAFLGLPT